jgi:hypothetical protein
MTEHFILVDLYFLVKSFLFKVHKKDFFLSAMGVWCLLLVL